MALDGHAVKIRTRVDDILIGAIGAVLSGLLQDRCRIEQGAPRSVVEH